MMKKLVLVSVLGALGLACGGADDQGGTQGDEQDVTSGRVTSAYSDTALDSCKLLSSGEEHSDSECKGIGAYSLLFHDRIWNGLTAGLKLGESEVDLSVIESLPQAERADGSLSFRAFGPKAEWRVPMNKLDAPFALGLRVIDDVEQPNGQVKKQHHLAVFKISGAKACLFALVEASVQSATANQIARDQMDKAQTQECPDLGKVTILKK